ncbi:MAG: ABC-F family ATP-binding cassette domain-containing protein [Clostridiaceae bacterium]|nr:ABC-F family ATP-binding cassette domain-containing protein [Clostridiaceae bacterium]
MLIAAEHLCKNYGLRQLLADVSVYVDSGDKIGIIGINGTGKSTLLRLLARAEEPDRGTVQLFPRVRAAYLPQNPAMDENAAVLEQVLRLLPDDAREAAEYEARAMLMRFGIANCTQRVGTLSGGQRKRAALAATLLQPADVLLLDEPTNHLDLEMVEWLEDYLRRFRGALVLITHDRYFLDRVVNRIVEVDHGALYSYEGGWSKYLELKAERLAMADASERKRQSILRREREWVMRGARARGTKSRDRLERYEALKNQAAPERDSTVQLAAASSRLGRKTIELENIMKAFGERTVLRSFSDQIARNDRVGIVGRNGAGKSTLLNLIAGRLEPDEGTIDIGSTVRIGYFTQEARELDPEDRVIDAVRAIANHVETAEGTFSASQLLERFLFPGDQQYAKIGSLSGGEKRRLFLLCVLIGAPNILLLDEPTNDLDVETLTILEDYLEGFPGAVLAVSHDRYFLDKLAERIVEVREAGETCKYIGGFTEYQQKRREDVPAPREKNKVKAAPRAALADARPRFSYKEQREYQTIDAELEALTVKKESIEAEIASAGSDYVKLQTLLEEQQTVEQALEEKTERWLYLTELAEKIAAWEA